MKLKNKKTGEIGVLTSDKRAKPYRKDYAVFVKVDDFEVGDRTYFYDTFAELCENWEDYKEPKPKEYWFIDEFGMVQQEIDYDYKDNEEAVHDKRKAIGNYFETKEEAEKAVEKLKAWKRLKETKMHFNDYHYELKNIDALALVTYKLEIEVDGFAYEGLEEDLELLLEVKNEKI